MLLTVGRHREGMTHPERNPDMNPDTNPDMNPSAASSRRRRGTILGVSAGVLGGGLVGLAMTVPTFTSAASDDTTDTTTDITVAALQTTDDTTTDDTTTDDSTVDTTDDTARPEPGVRLREALQALVDDGTITAEQADAVAEHLAAQAPERGGHRGHRGPGMDGEVVAGLLGIEADELRDALRDGQSIADLATANGVDVQTVIDALVAEAQGHLDLAVENGRLTEDEAAEKAADLEARITARVNGERPARD